MAYNLEIIRARPIMIETLEYNFTGVFMAKSTADIRTGPISTAQILEANSDGRNNSIKELIVGSTSNGLGFISDIHQNDNEKQILTFYLTGDAVDKLVYFRTLGTDSHYVTGIQTFPTVQSSSAEPIFIKFLSINLIDGRMEDMG